MELRTYLSILRRRKFVILATTVAGTLLAVILTLLSTPQYVSTTTMRVATVTDINYTQMLMNTYARIVTSATVKEQLVEQLNLAELPDITVELIPGTELMLIQVEAPNAETARDIASTAAEILVAQSREIYSGGGQSTQEIIGQQVALAEQELREARDEYDRLLADSPENTLALDAQDQSIALKERTYATLIDQYDKLRLNETLLANSVSIVEPAFLPLDPAKPRRTLNVVLGFIVGLVSGVCLAFLLENLDTTLYTTEQIETATQMDTVGRIPSAKEDMQIARLGEGHYPQIEAFRRLRTNILSMNNEDDPYVLLMTSAQRGEGKSTISANLAVTIAQSGLKVGLVDCDMRLPMIHKIFDLPNNRGLTSVLTKEVELEDVLLYSSSPRLQVLTSGPLPPNPTELLGTPQMAALIKALKEKFDYVVLDTPALMSVADAAVLTPMADNVILVVAQAKTKRGDVETVKKQLSNVRAKSIEVVVNRVDAQGEYTAYSLET